MKTAHPTIHPRFAMIMFLDFDGVLHPNPNEGHAFSCVENLWTILRRHEEIQVVFSTGWRFEHYLDELRELVSAGGGEDLAERFIDATPPLRHRDEAGSREKDCRAWLEAQTHDGPWLALDDMPSLFQPDSANLYAVNPKRGLMHYDVERIGSRIRSSL